jgi:arginine decarboxylase
MILHVASAIGRAATELAAFDQALISVGAANFNLVRLSSVIPPGSSVVESRRCPEPERATWGDRLYVVYAEWRTSTPGEAAWSGVGWVQDRDSGRGLFVEHEGTDEWMVRNDITASREALQNSRGIDFGPIRMHVIGAECQSEPVCALVLCAYQSEPWSTT